MRSILGCSLDHGTHYQQMLEAVLQVWSTLASAASFTPQIMKVA